MARILAAILALALCSATRASAGEAPFTVDGNVALASLASLSDNHLRTMADTLDTLAATQAARSGDWQQIREALKEAASVNVPAILLYARPNGTYWTIQSGRQTATISDRAYFKRALAGQRTIGELVLSRSSGKPVAIVAVPVTGKDGAVTGVLAGSIYLDQLSSMLAAEMQLGAGTIFWAIDAHGKIALHSDASNVFVDPAKMSSELQRVTARMLENERGAETYVFRGQKRTVIYQKSSVTGWTYGFGVTR